MTFYLIAWIPDIYEQIMFMVVLKGNVIYHLRITLEERHQWDFVLKLNSFLVLTSWVELLDRDDFTRRIR